MARPTRLRRIVETVLDQAMAKAGLELEGLKRDETVELMEDRLRVALWGLAAEAALKESTVPPALKREAKRPEFFHPNLRYQIEIWAPHDETVWETVAFTGNVYVAHAAFETAVQRNPGRRLLLRNRTRVLHEYADGTVYRGERPRTDLVPSRDVSKE